MYSAVKIRSFRGAGGIRLWLSKQVGRLKVFTVRYGLMSDGSEFQVSRAATENARWANSLRVLGTVSSGASDDSRGRTGTAVWIRSLKYVGVAENIVLKVTYVNVARCLSGSQWSDLRSVICELQTVVMMVMEMVVVVSDQDLRPMLSKIKLLDHIPAINSCSVSRESHAGAVFHCQG